MTEVKVRMVKDGAFPVNERLAGLVPMATEVEQTVLTADIEKNEQREPVVLWKGQIVDGRCRQQALVTLGKHILYKELADNLTEDEVRIFVKSVNTRRNLTQTQKIMVACRESLKPESASVIAIAKAWGIGDKTLKMARYVAKQRPEFIDPLFNGHAVTITSKDGKEIQSSKVTAIYAYLKKLEEQASLNTEYAWEEGSHINTQLGKEWYYSIVATLGQSDNVAVKMALAELANYKFCRAE